MDPREIGGQFMIQATARPGVDLARGGDRPSTRRWRASSRTAPPPQEVQRVRTQYLAGFVRGRRADRRLRRQVRRAGDEPGVPGRSRRPTRPSSPACARPPPPNCWRPPSAGSPTAMYELEVARSAIRECRHSARRPQQAARRPAQPPELRLPKLERIDALQRPEGGAGRAARDPHGQFRTDGGFRLCRRPVAGSAGYRAPPR